MLLEIEKELETLQDEMNKIDYKIKDLLISSYDTYMTLQSQINVCQFVINSYKQIIVDELDKISQQVNTTNECITKIELLNQLKTQLDSIDILNLIIKYGRIDKYILMDLILHPKINDKLLNSISSSQIELLNIYFLFELMKTYKASSALLDLIMQHPKLNVKILGDIGSFLIDNASIEELNTLFNLIKKITPSVVVGREYIILDYALSQLIQCYDIDLVLLGKILDYIEPYLIKGIVFPNENTLDALIQSKIMDVKLLELLASSPAADLQLLNRIFLSAKEKNPHLLKVLVVSPAADLNLLNQIFDNIFDYLDSFYKSIVITSNLDFIYSKDFEFICIPLLGSEITNALDLNLLIKIFSYAEEKTDKLLDLLKFPSTEPILFYAINSYLNIMLNSAQHYKADHKLKHRLINYLEKYQCLNCFSVAESLYSLHTQILENIAEILKLLAYKQTDLKVIANILNSSMLSDEDKTQIIASSIKLFPDIAKNITSNFEIKELIVKLELTSLGNTMLEIIKNKDFFPKDGIMFDKLFKFVPLRLYSQSITNEENIINNSTITINSRLNLYL